MLINTSAVCSQARSLSPLRLASIGRSHPVSRGAFEFFLCIADRSVVDLVVHANPSWLTRRTIMLSIDQQCCRSNFNIDHFSPSVGFDPMTLSLLPQARQPLGDLVATTSQCRCTALTEILDLSIPIARSRADLAGKHPCAPAIDASSLSLAIDTFAWLCAPTRTP